MTTDADVIVVGAGIAGLVLALIVGKRLGFGSQAMRPHNVPVVMLGAGLLWFGWFGFNAGSELAADGLVLPLNPTASTRAQFPSYALAAFSYGTAVKRLYGAPVALENIGLVVNTKLAKVPTTWASRTGEPGPGLGEGTVSSAEFRSAPSRQKRSRLRQ